MGNFIPDLAQEFAYTSLAFLLGLGLLGLYALGKIVFVEGRGALFDHLDTAAKVYTIYFEISLFRLIYFLFYIVPLSLLVCGGGCLFLTILLLQHFLFVVSDVDFE